MSSSVEMEPAPLDGVRATLQGLAISGEGETPRDAVIALVTTLKSLQAHADA